MSMSFKLILPLLNKEITKKDISLNSGFIDIYSYDINKPFMDHHIFLLYSNEIFTPQAIETAKKLKALNNLYCFRNLTIKGKSYRLYSFTVSKTISDIEDNKVNLNYSDKLKVASFWELKDTDINDYLIDNTNTLYIEFKNKVVPEEDYKPSFAMCEDEKSGVLLIEVPRFNFFKSSPIHHRRIDCYLEFLLEGRLIFLLVFLLLLLLELLLLDFLDAPIGISIYFAPTCSLIALAAPVCSIAHQTPF